MIDLINNQDLAIEQRLNILQRALYTQPYFTLLSFTITPSLAADRGQVFASEDDIVLVNKDFYLTELKGNFNEVYVNTGSLFNVSIFTVQNEKNIWRYIKSLLLASGFQMTEARERTAFANQIFVDIQSELIPFQIAKGDSIQATIKNIVATTNLTDVVAKIALAGYYVVNATGYISDRLQIGIKESLEREIIFETWTNTIDFTGIQTKSFKNDRYPRLVLGFGIVDKDTNKAIQSTGTMRITDQFRGLRFSAQPLPIEFYAPRLTCLRDTHCYYLPTEYLLEPFASLDFEISNALNTGSGYDLIMFTRTV